MLREKWGSDESISKGARRCVGCLPPAVYKTYIRLLVVLLELGTANAGRAAFPGVAACRNDITSSRSYQAPVAIAQFWR